ncbi:MAG: hypothetical protein ABIP03_11745 [Aquihabitans sp.]
MNATPFDEAARPGPGDLERLVSGLGSWLASFARRSRQLILLVAGLASGAGLLAMALAVAAWHDPASVGVMVAILCLPAVLAPVVVARRIRPLSKAAADPTETTRQAREYFASLRPSSELSSLITKASDLHRGGPKLGVRSIWKTSKLVGQLVQNVTPDPVRQPLLAAFEPERLRKVWTSLFVAGWLWFAAVLVSFVAAFALIVRVIA